MNAEPAGWTVEEGRLVRRYRFPDFASGLRFVNAVGALAEEQGHHPEVALAWGRVVLRLWTFDAGALTDADHRLAAAIDGIPPEVA